MEERTPKVGQFVQFTLALHKPTMPFLVTHVHDDFNIGGVAFAGDRGGLGWYSPTNDYLRIRRGTGQREWDFYLDDGAAAAEGVSANVVRTIVAAEVEKIVGPILKRLEEAEAGVAAGPTKPTGDALDEAIVSAIESLESGNAEHFTAKGSGLPRVEAIEAVLGFDIDAADRDRVWSAMHPDSG